LVKAVKEILNKEFEFRPHREFRYSVPDYCKIYNNFTVYLLCYNGTDWSRSYISLNLADAKPIGLSKFEKKFKKYWKHYTLKQFKEMLNYLEKWDREYKVMLKLKDLNKDFV
jgi:hypothetical protein